MKIRVQRLPWMQMNLLEKLSLLSPPGQVPRNDPVHDLSLDLSFFPCSISCLSVLSRVSRAVDEI